MKEEYVIIDFAGKKIGDLTMNGQPIEGLVQFDENRIKINKLALVQGQNTMELVFENEYRTNDSVGLYAFTLDDDNQQYLYSQFCAGYGHYVFPCFDQPDLKAKWTFMTVVPEDWTVISNEPKDEGGD